MLYLPDSMPLLMTTHVMDQNYLNDLQNTELKKNDKRHQKSKQQKKNSRSLKKIQESTSVSLKKSQSTPEKHKLWLNEAMKTIHDLKIEFIKKKNIKETQAKVKIELKNPKLN